MRNKKLILGSLLLMVFLIIPNSTNITGALGVTSSQESVDVIIMFSEDVDVKLKIPEAKISHEYSIINGISASIPSGIVQKIESLPFVSSLDLDATVSLSEDTLDWGVDKINAEIVWGGAENAVDVQPGTFAGQGVKIAILDTGIQHTHPDLDDNYYGGYDFVNNDNDPMDDHYHGTHVAGIIAAEDNGLGVIGVAPQAQLYGVKVLDAQGSGSYSNIIAGIDWSVTNGMDIISMSLGGSSGTTALEQALQNAYDSGVVIIAASGNDYGGPIGYPAKYSSVVAVGATDSNDNIASYSNVGPEQEVVAPGSSIYSTYSGSSYGTLSGTSMATPMVSGLVALMLSKNPNLSPTSVRQYLQSTSLDLGATGFDNTYGHGRVQADQAVNAVPPDSPGDTIPPEQVTGLTVTTISSSQLDLSWNSVSDSDLSHYKIYRDGNSIGTSSTTSYSDTGLTPSTTYNYEISAVDSSNNEGIKSSPVSGTTDPSSGTDTLHVFAIEISYDSFYFWFWVWYDVYITVTAYDGNGNPITGVTVSIDLTIPDGTVLTGSKDTGADGTVTFLYQSGLNEWGLYTATVTNLAKTGYTYAPGDNLETSTTVFVL